ncbi:MAG: hypothetical protein WC333_00835 [Dehalococcoidia bacterium]|jgi:hypothetical protein
MALDTKPNLSDSKFEQRPGEILHLSGSTHVHDYGEFRLQSGATFVMESSPGVNKVLVSNATGCGSWGNVPVYNGLSVCDSGRAALGGTLSGDTEIEICSYKFQVSGVENLIALTGDSAIVYASGATLYLKDGCASLSSDIGDCLFMSPVATTFTSASGGGIKYGGDYSSNYTSRSLVDKGYVTGLTANMITGATNGIGVTGRRVCLGGTLGATNTTLSLASPVATFMVCYTGNSAMLVNGAGTAMCTCGATLLLNGDVYLSSCSNDRLCMDTNGVVFTVNSGGGVRYAADYSGSYTLRSLVDKGYVTGLTSSISTLIASGERITKCINKTSHGFAVQDVIGWSGGTYNKAIADGTYDGEVLGIVSKCHNANYFDLTQAGYVTGLTGLVINTTYFLSDATAGLLTATEPTTVDHISKAVLIANSTTTGWVLPYPGYIITSGVTPSVAWGDISGSIADQTDLQTVLLKSVTGVTNLGAGNGALYTSVSDQLIQLKRLSGGTNITITSGDSYVVINSTATGTVTGAESGLHLSGPNVALGGLLTGNTTICGAYAFNLGCTGSALSSLIAVTPIFGVCDGNGYTCMRLEHDPVAPEFDMLLVNSGGTAYGGINLFPTSTTKILLAASEDTNYLEFKLSDILGATNSNFHIQTENSAASYEQETRLNHPSGTVFFCEVIECKSSSSQNLKFLGDYKTRNFCFIRNNAAILTILSGGTARYGSAVALNNDCDLVYKSYLGSYVAGGTITGATNLGTGNGTIYTTTTNNKLNLKTLSGGTNVTLTCSGNYIAINANDASGIEWNGTTANGIGTYIDANTICSQPNLTFNGTRLGVMGNICASTCVTSPLLSGTTCVTSPIVCGSTCMISPVIIGSTCVRSPILSATTYSTSPVFIENGTCLASKYLPFQMATDMQDPTGFVDGSNINISYNYTNRTITLTGTLDYYWKGVKRTLTSPWTSSAHTATVGRWYLYSTDGLGFTWSQSVWEFNHIMVSGIYYQATEAASLAIRETHGLLDWQAHETLHNTIGTYLKSGGQATSGSYTANTATNAGITPSFNAASLDDEDLTSTIASWPKTSGYTVMRISAGTSVYTFSNTAPFLAVGDDSYIYVNDPVTGTLTAGVANRYYNAYQILVPTTSDSNSQKYRMIFLPPQATYTTLAGAQAEDTRGLRLGSLTSASAEYVIYARISYSTSNSYSNYGKVVIPTDGITYVVGSKFSALSVAGVSTTNHANLSNLTWTDSGHLGNNDTLAAFNASGVAEYVSKLYYSASGHTHGIYALQSSVATYTGTTAPATYVIKTAFDTYTGTTVPATYVAKTVFITYTGTTAPATFLKCTSASIQTINSCLKIGVPNSVTLTASASTFSISKAAENYGLYMGLIGSGVMYMQSGSFDGATQYPLCFQPQGSYISTPVIKITTGAAAGCVLTSSADGTASWSTPIGGGVGVYMISGNSLTTGFSVTHSCNQQFVMVQLVQADAPYATVYTNVQRTNANCVCITFDTAPSTGINYKILITG